MKRFFVAGICVVLTSLFGIAIGAVAAVWMADAASANKEPVFRMAAGGFAGLIFGACAGFVLAKAAIKRLRPAEGKNAGRG